MEPEGCYCYAIVFQGGKKKEQISYLCETNMMKRLILCIEVKERRLISHSGTQAITE